MDDRTVLDRLMSERYSCRGYLPDAIPRETIEVMLGLAQKSPSWCNTQPWTVIVTEKQATESIRRKLYEYAAQYSSNGKRIAAQPDISFPTSYSGIYRERRRELGVQMYKSASIPKNDRIASEQQALENFRFFGAPHILLITSPKELGVYGAVDCGIYLGNLLLAAQSLKINMTPQAALAAHSHVMRDHFEIPDDQIIVVGASFGYADTTNSINKTKSSRAPHNEAVTFLSE